MKKLIYLIVIVLISSLVLTGCSLLSDISQVPATDQSSIVSLTKGTSGPIILYAGQHIPVGTVSVWNDGVELHVIYNTTDPWVMTETHLAVVTDIDDFPTNKADNPKVGHFPYSKENIFQNTWEKIIVLSAIPAKAGQELFIAAHAVVVDTSITMEEVVVSRPGIDVYGPLSVNTNLGDPSWGTANLAVATYVHPSWPSILDATWISTAYYTEEPVANNSWRWFHDEINIQGYPLAGNVVSATADNAEEVYLNGVSIGSNNNWASISNYTISPQPGLNTLDFIVRNYAGSTDPKSNPTGLIYKTTISYYPEEESAWAGIVDDGTGIIEISFPGKNWAAYFTYDVQGFLTGTWLLNVNNGVHMHDMFIVTQSQSGALTGTGRYPTSGPPYTITWALTNSLVTTDGSSVTLTLDYDSSTYEATLTGTVDQGWNEMSGGLGTGGVTSWVATRQL